MSTALNDALEIRIFDVSIFQESHVSIVRSILPIVMDSSAIENCHQKMDYTKIEYISSAGLDATRCAMRCRDSLQTNSMAIIKRQTQYHIYFASKISTTQTIKWPNTSEHGPI